MACYTALMRKIVYSIVIVVAISAMILPTVTSMPLSAQAQPPMVPTEPGGGGATSGVTPGTTPTGPGYFVENLGTGAKIPIQANNPAEAAQKAKDIINQQSPGGVQAGAATGGVGGGGGVSADQIQGALQGLTNLPKPPSPPSTTGGVGNASGIFSWGCSALTGWGVCKWL